MAKKKMDYLYDCFQSLEDNELILDVRSAEEYAEGHVPKSENIPYQDLQNHVEKLNKYTKIYIYCRLGGRAQRASEILNSLGITTQFCIDDSGMEYWIEKGYPVLK